MGRAEDSAPPGGKQRADQLIEALRFPGSRLETAVGSFLIPRWLSLFDTCSAPSCRRQDLSRLQTVKDQSGELRKPKQRAWGHSACSARRGEESRATCGGARSRAKGSGSWRHARPLSRLHSPGPPTSRLSPASPDLPLGLASAPRPQAVQPRPRPRAIFLPKTQKVLSCPTVRGHH